jgi:hypothetical protein
MDLVFTEPNHTGVGFDVSYWATGGGEGWHISVFNKIGDEIGKFQVSSQGDEPFKNFFGIWCEETIGRINIYDKSALGDRIDNIQMWREIGPVEYRPSLALHADLGLVCDDPCPNVMVDHSYLGVPYFVNLIVRNYGDEISGVQMAFDWDPAWDIFLGWQDCPEVISVMTPSGPGPVAGTLVSVWDCIVGGVGVPVGGLFLINVGGGCVSVVETELGGNQIADCSIPGVLTPVDSDCWGRTCFGSGGINVCDCPTPSSVEGTPEVTSGVLLSQPVPNPTTRSITYAVTLERESRVRVRVYDVTGRVVSSPLDESLPAGVHTFAWSALDDRGRGLPAGVYYMRLDADGVRTSRKFVVMR